jgi:hypothetical protein
MSRTFRKPPGFAMPSANPAYHLNDTSYGDRYQRHIDRLKLGMDGVYQSNVCEPTPDAPKGFHTWNTVPTGGRKYAKRMAAKILRRRGAHDIQRTLRAD